MHLTAKALFLPVLSILMAAVIWSSCHHQPANPDADKTGEALSKVYCASCHMYPAPNLLDKKTWANGVLPAMAVSMGIYRHGGQSYFNNAFYNRPGRLLSPMVDSVSFDKIYNFYIAGAPDKLPNQTRPSEILGEDHAPFISLAFGVQKPGPPPSTTLVKIDSGRKQLVSGSMLDNSIAFYSQPLTLQHRLFVRSAPVSIDLGSIANRQDTSFSMNHLYITCIGSIRPSDVPLGTVEKIDIPAPSTAHTTAEQASTPSRSGSSLFTALPRPVQTIVLDLDQDGRNDYLICGFGHTKGELFWMKNTGHGYEKKVLRTEPGAIHAVIQDVNGDGKPDIYVLFAQAREGISLFLNQGKGEFKEIRIMDFPPVYGSSSFDMVDVDNDGRPDIVYTAGDNADYSPILKYYHGMYIYLNQGNNHFKQSYFYPMHGCYKALASDFDKDGKKDFITISYFADYAGDPKESMLYFKNTTSKKSGSTLASTLTFEVSTMPQADKGRWLTMDVGDLDGNGTDEIVAGNFSIGPTNASDAMKAHWKQGPPFMVWKYKGNN